MTELQTASPPRKRHRFQFSLRTLLVVMLLASVGLSWLLEPVRRQKAAVEAIRKLGGRVTYDFEVRPLRSPGPAWWQSLLGADFHGTVIHVYLYGSSVSDTDLEHLEGLTQLQVLDLHDCRISDSGLEHLKDLTQLRSLGLFRARVTDAGVKHLQGLTQLGELDLTATQVSDAGLKHLGEMPNLVSLDLSGTRVSDAGLKHLVGLTQLQTLDLSGTKITTEGVKKLQQALPDCKIEDKRPLP